MKALASLAAVMLATACTSAPPPASVSDASPAGAPGDSTAGRKLLFADEFDGNALDRTKWSVIGADFWVNEEQQAYLDRPDTIAVRGGSLVLTPRFDPGADTLARRKADFVSGRIVTEGKFDFTYGRAEARIRMPEAQGVWPAFWLLGNRQWPHSGEIDIMEYVGEPDWTAVALHGPG